MILRSKHLNRLLMKFCTTPCNSAKYVWHNACMFYIENVCIILDDLWNRYQENVKRVSALFKDRPNDPMDLGVYWIEYVLRHKGARHLRNAGRKLNSLQYHSVDVIGAYLAIIGIILYCIFKILRFLGNKICKRGNMGSKNTGNKLVGKGKKTN